jgi:hypothetical protein
LVVVFFFHQNILYQIITTRSIFSFIAGINIYLVSTCRIQHIQKKKGEKHAEKEIWPLQTTVSMLFNRTKRKKKGIARIDMQGKSEDSKKKENHFLVHLLSIFIGKQTTSM